MNSKELNLLLLELLVKAPSEDYGNKISMLDDYITRLKKELEDKKRLVDYLSREFIQLKRRESNVCFN